MKSDASSPLSRRKLLAGFGGVALMRTASGQVIQTPAAVSDPTKTPGAPVGKLGARAAAEQLGRRAFGPVSQTPLQHLHGTITPADLHFERHHAGIPAIDPERYELLIHGMVERPLKFTLADLKRFPATSRICFIECSGNLNYRARERTTPQMLAGLTSQTEWTGVMLSTLLREVGVKPNAAWCLAEGSDAAVMTRSIPVTKLMDDAMIAYAQNGEAVRPAQGYPARLLLPGWEGNTSVKWLRRLEFSDAPFMTREETSKYTEPLRGGKARQFSLVMDARSVITFPAYPVVLDRGWVEIRGLAWTGRGRIERVEVSTDAGKSWQVARLQEPVLAKAHTRFGHLWKWDGSETEIMSRAVDETGYVQPTKQQLIDARGLGALPYHLNPITAWKVEADGQLRYRPDPWG